jgi:predicted AAA+ superfamily ATPase
VIVEDILKVTNQPSLIFVDEVQKTPEVFDTLKFAFDKGGHSFIVSGSNPAFLGSIAKKRLQRRAEQIFLLPISLAEILVNQKSIPETFELFNEVLFNLESIGKFKLPIINSPSNLNELSNKYFRFGGLPLAFLAEDTKQCLKEIRQTVERGFELMDIETNNLADRVRTELAYLQSKYFLHRLLHWVSENK